MNLNTSYKFEVSLSNDAYENKEISNAMIGTTKEKSNRDIRKKYGYPANKGVGYTRTSITLSELYDKLINGHVFCHLFNTEKPSFKKMEKNDRNFSGSYVIGVDIDKTNYSSVEEFVDKLSIKPSFYYTTYSNLKDNKGARFRLIYVFDELIQSKYYFRFCAYNLNKIIERDTDEIIDDECNLRCSQYLNGTNQKNPDIVFSSKLFGYVYSLSEINSSSLEDYREFLRNDCFYKTKDKKRSIVLNSIIITINDIIYNNNNNNKTTTYYNTAEKKDTFETISCSPEMINDMKYMEYDRFMRFYRHKYTYFWDSRTENWIDDTYQFVDDNYFSLFWNINKVKDGNCRRKKLFQRMCLRRVLNPEVDADTLLFNAYEDVARFFEIDNDLTVDCLVRNVENAMSYEIEDIEDTYSESIEYLKSRRPKKGIIYKLNGKAISTVAGTVLYQIVDENYDTDLSVKDNLKRLNDYVIPVGKTFLYDYLKKKGIKVKYTDEEISELIDVNLSVRKNVEIIKSNGISISKDRVCSIINSIKNNNITNNNKTITTTYYNNTEKKDTSLNTIFPNNYSSFWTPNFNLAI